MMRTRVVKIHLYEDDILWDIYIYDIKKKSVSYHHYTYIIYMALSVKTLPLNTIT